MINIFLDSTALYNDPFFKHPFGRLILDLQASGKINIYISRIVLDETFNNYEKQLKGHYENISKEIKLLNSLSLSTTTIQLETIESEMKILNDFYDNKFERYIFTLVDYDDTVLPQLIKRSIKRIKPFTESRQEFRDAIIWLSYITFIKNDRLTRNFFITNNKRDFWDDKNTGLHPELQSEIKDLKVCSNFQELCTQESTILSVVKERKFSEWFEKQKITQSNVLSLIKTQLWSSIEDAIKRKIDRLNPKIYFNDIPSAYFEYNFQKDDLNVKEFNVSQVADFGCVDCDLTVDSLAIIYPLENYKTIERRSIVFSIELTFIFDTSFNINDFQVLEVQINYKNYND